MRETRLKRNRSLYKQLKKKSVINVDPEQFFLAIKNKTIDLFPPNVFNVKDENFTYLSKLTEISHNLDLLNEEIEFNVKLKKETLFKSNFQIKNVQDVFAIFNNIFLKVHQIHFEVQNNSFDVTNI